MNLQRKKMKFTPILVSVVAITMIGSVVAFTSTRVVTATSQQRGLTFLPRLGLLSTTTPSSTPITKTTTSSLSAAAASSTEQFVQNEIKNHKVLIFSKSYCPYCTATKELFKTINVNAKIYELDNMDNGDDIQSTLLSLTGQRTVPNVWINTENIGGNDKTQSAYASGTLTKMLDNAGVSYNKK